MGTGTAVDKSGTLQCYLGTAVAAAAAVIASYLTVLLLVHLLLRGCLLVVRLNLHSHCLGPDEGLGRGP